MLNDRLQQRRARESFIAGCKSSGQESYHRGSSSSCSSWIVFIHHAERQSDEAASTATATLFSVRNQRIEEAGATILLNCIIETETPAVLIAAYPPHGPGQ